MAPSKAPTSWDESDSDTSGSEASAPAVAVPVSRRKFEDEEDEEVLDNWEEEEDSEVEREKAKKAAAAKAEAEAKAKAAHKSRGKRIEERIEENRRKKESLLEVDSEDEEDEAERRARARANEKESDLRNAEDLFGGVGGVPSSRGAKPVTVLDESDPGNAIDLSSLSLFDPKTPQQFQQLRDTLVRLLTANSKKPQYALFMPEFTKQLCKDLNSEQVRKIGGVLNTLSNEKMKEEKAGEKGGKKSKAAKTKTSLNANRDVSRVADTMAYDDDGLDDGDFM